MSYKVRPFERVIDFSNIGGGNAPVKCTGRIEDGVFVLQLGPGVHRLPTASVSADQWGDFAEIEACRLPLEHGFVLEVEPEDLLDPGDPNWQPGCSISLLLPEDGTTERLVRKMGIDPTNVNLIAPPRLVLSVYFHYSGVVNGVGGICRAASPNDVPPTTH